MLCQGSETSDMTPEELGELLEELILMGQDLLLYAFNDCITLSMKQPVLEQATKKFMHQVLEFLKSLPLNI